MHKARTSQLLPLPTDTEETHGGLSAVAVLTFRQNLLVNDSEKTNVKFSCKNNFKFFSSIDGFF